MLVIVAKEFKDFTMGAGEGINEDEYLITRIECFSPALNIVNCYSKQRRTKKEEVEAKWERLRKDIEAIQSRNEFCLLAGDMNMI